jgi:MFS family permease
MAQGLLMVINQGLIIKRFWLVKFTEDKLTIFAIAGLAAAFAFMAIPVFWMFIVGTILAILGHSLFRTTLTSEAVGMAVPTEKGEVLGIMASIMSLGMIIGPLISEPTYAWGDNYPYLLSSALLIISLLIILTTHRRLLKRVDLQTEVDVI